MIKNKVTVIRSKPFNVHTDGKVRLLEKGGSILGRSIEIPKGSRIIVSDIDFYTNSVIATWQDKTISIDYDFMLHNVYPDGPILTSTVPAIEVIECEYEDTPVGLSQNTIVIISAIAFFTLLQIMLLIVLG